MFTTDDEGEAIYAATGKACPVDCTLMFFSDLLGSLEGIEHIGIGMEVFFGLLESDGSKN